MRTTTAALAMAALTVLAVPAHAERPWSNLGVMTLNQYFGADIGLAFGAPPDRFNEALLSVLKGIVATNFRERAAAQARQIVRRRPDVVGLQEVLALSCVDDPEAPPPPPGQGCDHPSIAPAFLDHLDVTLRALDALGADYEAVAVVKNLDLADIEIELDDGTVLEPPGVPFEIDGRRAFLRAIDRDVILARQDTAEDAEPFEFPEGLCRTSLDGCNFRVVVPVEQPIPGGTLRLGFERGFVAVDTTVRGQKYRVVNTHLEVSRPVADEPLSGFFQVAQAAELIALFEAVRSPGRRLLVVGDINSSPEDPPIPGPLPLPEPFDQGLIPPYQQFVMVGYTDLWTFDMPDEPGFTCCQAEDLRNEESLLDERIDVLLSRDEPTRVFGLRVIGEEQADRTPSGLWPSDHAGVVGRVTSFGADD